MEEGITQAQGNSSSMKGYAWEERILWYEKYIGQTRITSNEQYINLSAHNIATVFNNHSSLYLLYKAKKRNNFFMGIFELKAAEMIGIYQLQSSNLVTNATFYLKAIGTKATGTSDETTQVTWYLSHAQGVLRLDVTMDESINNNFRELYSNLLVNEDTTLAKFQDYHFLCGGHLNNGIEFLASSSNGEGISLFEPHHLTWARRINPINEYVKGYMYTFGGLPRNEVLKNYYIEYKEIRVKDKNAFKSLNSGVVIIEPSKIITTIPPNIEESELNTKNYRSTVLEDNIYIFPVTIFKKMNYFYIFNTTNKTFVPYKVPNEIVDKVKNNNLADYTDIQVTTAKNTIFFTLTKSDFEALWTQIIGFYTERLDRAKSSS
ncbi:MAG: hypothetical protein AAGB33_00250 [Cellulomonas sp.]|nr:hypothetical protein [Rickettsiella sp.]